MSRPPRDGGRPPRDGAPRPARPNRSDRRRPGDASTGAGPAKSSAPRDRKPPSPDGGLARPQPRPPAPGASAPPRGVRAKPAPRKPPAPELAPLPDEPQRIAKLLARAGVASRRDIERMIEEGRVALNGEVIAQPAPLLTSLAGVTVDGNPVGAAAATRIFRFYKPVGCLTAARDPAGRRTIYDVLPKDLPRLLPVGRLDMNTEGLLLLTNDGELKRALELPANAVKRTYRVRVFGEVTQVMLEALAEGVTVEGVRYGSIIADLERRTGRNGWLSMTLTEGKNREIRRVMEHLGVEVTRLIRVAYGEFPLGDLAPGAVDEIPARNVKHLRNHLGLDKA